ncbi:tape measure protein [Brachybacterium subflavum]|uniref:tape measure protein n=1 Tax=Brachybacterium subflavum TaxID=2585206 RepID=UPI001266412B|nr:tape measure protein [Brachybacterium subflavum]
MAVGGSPTIATAAIGLIPVIQGVRGNIASQLAGSGVMSSANSAGKSVGQNFATSAMSAAKTGLKFGGIVAGAIGAVTIKGGFDRALGIEDAQAKMKGLGYDTKSVSKIMDNALASVEGTSYGLDEAATTASGAVAAGIKPGQQLEGVLKTVANTAAATGSTMDEVGSIFNTVKAVGSAYTGDINMLAQRGIPIWQSLSKTLGKSQDQVRKMATKGEIDFATFEKAAKDASGGVATAMGDTTRGSFANMYAAVKKLGAMFVTGVLPLAKTTFQGIQGLLSAVKNKLDPLVQGFFDKFGGKAQAGIKSFFDTLIAGVNGFDPTPLINFFGKVGKVGGGVFKELTGGIKAFGAAWKYNDGDITSSGFPGFMEGAAYQIHQFWDALKGMDFSGVSSMFSSLGKSIQGIKVPTGAGGGIAGFGESLQAIGQAAPGVLALGLNVLAKALEFLSKNAGTIAKLMPLIVAGFIAWKVHATATNDALIAQRAATAAMAPVMLSNNALILLNNILEGKRARAKVVSTAAENVQTGAINRATLAEKGRALATKIGTAVSKGAALAARGLGLAIRFMTGPIGLVITGITLLVAGLVWFFTQTKTGKAIIATVWAGIKAAMAAVVSWFQGTALPIIKAVWDGIATGALWLYNNAILPAWNGIKAAVGAVANWAQTSLVPFFQSAWNLIAAGAQWLYRSVILPVWQGIKVAFAIVVAAVTVYVKAWVAIFKYVVAPVFIWLYNSVIKPVWAAIKKAITAVVAWFRDTAWPILKVVVSAVGSFFKWLYASVIKPVWGAIKTAISAVVGWFRDTAWPVLKSVIGYIHGRFLVLRLKLLEIWGAIKKNIIAPVVSWFRDTVAPLFEKVIGYIKGRFIIFHRKLLELWGAIKNKVIKPVVDWFKNSVVGTFSNAVGSVRSKFQGLKDKLSEVWSAIKNKAVKPVADWFTSTVKPKIDTFVDGLKTGFKGLKDSVLKAWDGIKSGMKKPINGIINIYRDHIKTPFNSVINKILGGKAGKKWNLPDMQPFATGGWTGPGARLQPAGVVHADEFVVKKSSRRGIERQAPGFLDQLNTHGARALTRMGMGYASGGRVLHGYKDIESIPHTGVSVTSTVRKGARTAGTGSVSKHAKGYAVDFAGTAQAMKEFFNYVRSNYKVSELIHTPMGGKQLSRGGIPKAHFPAKTAQMHYNHVHVGGYEPGEKQGAGTSGAGGGLFDNPFTGLWKKISSKVSSTAGEGALGGLLTGVTKKVVGSAKDFVGKKISEAFDFVGDTWDSAKAGAKGVLSKAKASWWATKALVHTGAFNGTNLSSLLRRMNQESGFQVGAQNNWDSNAAKGQASRGLMQVIPSTFAAYRDKSLPNDIFDPLANIVASINYTKSRYGSLTRGWDRKGGYAAGGYTGPGPRLAPAGIVHADEFVLRSEAQRSISKVAPGFLDRLNRMGAGAIGYAKGGLVGYASGGKVSPTAKIGSSKVTVLLEGLSGTEKQVTSAAGKLADGIVKTFNDRMKAAKTTTVNKLSDSLSSLKKEASALKKSISATTSKSKKNTVNRLVDDLAALRKQQSTLKATAREVSKVTKVTGKTKTGKLITKTVTSSTAAAKKAAKDLKGVQKQIDSTQSALTRARRGDYSGAAAAATKRLKSVQAEIDKTDKALKAARRGDYQNAALLKGTKAYNKYAAGAVSKLESYAARTDTLTAKLKTANTKLSDAQKLWTDYRSSMVEKFQGTYALSEESATTGIETIIRGFKNGAATVKTFASQLNQLKAKGLSGGLVDQIAQMGAESGSKVAKNLLTGSSSQIKEITKQYNALNTASTTSGTSLADQMYRNGVNSAKGLVKGLESQLANVEKASETLANTVLATVRKKLGIHSPSRELDSDGQNSAIGYGNGVYKQIPYAQKALAEMVATPDMSGLRDVGRAEMRPAAQIRAYTPVAGGSEPSVVYQFGDIHGHTAEDVVAEFKKDRRRQLALRGA